MAIQQKITPHLWFDSNAEQAVALPIPTAPTGS